MTAITGLKNAPIFPPIVSSFYSGMEVTVPIFAEQISGSISDIKEIYKEAYASPIISYRDADDESGFLSAAKYADKDSMGISVFGNEERIILVARYDNLGKGASGAAVECLNVKLGCDKAKTLVI